MTALTEHILDTALRLANASPWGRLCPPMLACLDELPSTAPLPTLRTRMANERALGISIIYAAQTWRQLVALFGDTEARAIFGLTNVLALFGGSKDVGFNKEVSDLVGTTRVARTTWQLGQRGGRSASGDDMLILRPEEDPPTPRTPRTHRRREHPAHHRQTPPLHRRQATDVSSSPSRPKSARRPRSSAERTQPGDDARAVAALAAARKHALIEE